MLIQRNTKAAQAGETMDAKIYLLFLIFGTIIGVCYLDAAREFIRKSQFARPRKAPTV